jgi:Tfp pilus assembly protein PilV
MSPTNRLSSAARRNRGFTLVEVMIGSTLSIIVLAGVMTAFLMLGRSGYNAANYSMMEAESRRALEMFSTDARMSNYIKWNSNASVTLRISGQYVTYGYDNSTSGATAQCFYRMPGEASSTAQKLILVRNVTEFSFRRYKVINGVDFTANNDLETKQIQITLRSVRTGTTTVAATNAVLSARVVLRNKVVTT